ncbi:TetR/AcrR family transcriptional regulator [Mesorhizobium kowhaii]|uniref:TetR/AcrR family transcriptional regulator n=1 Tax=Mesorhizobium kowhaii TaxID=1300272 RepID=UPI0035EB64E6
MAKLREKQKERRIQAIIAAAGEEFRAAGYNEAKIETIASTAEVAPATIYNYFGDKAGLLLALFREHSKQTRALMMQAAMTPPDDALLAIDRYFVMVFDNSMSDLTRELWCEAYAASYKSPSLNLGGIVSETDARLYADMKALFEILQSRGVLGSAISAHDLAEVALAVGNLQWTRFLTGQIEIEAARTEAIRQIRILLDAAGRSGN